MSEKKDKVVTFMLSPTELAAIDDWRYENRIPSRGEAIRQLVRLGFNAAVFGKPKKQSNEQEPKRDDDYGSW